ncbi:hypothetical protein V2J09_002277 [Rumex salicifolius]
MAFSLFSPPQLSSSGLLPPQNCSPAASRPLSTATLYTSVSSQPIAGPRSVNVSACAHLFGVAVGEDLPEDYESRLPKRDTKDKRRAGILLHPTSLHGNYGIGDLGEQTFRFIDWLHDCGCAVWQVLPLVPPGRKANEDGSPYSGQDANCGNTLLISLEELVKDGLLLKSELPEPIEAEMVDFSSVAKIKDPLVAKASGRLITSEGELREQYDEFCRDPDIMSWLEDAAYFAAVDDTIDSFSWYQWPSPLKDRHLVALVQIYESRREYINTFIAQQFLFQRQWKRVRDYARKKGVKIMGDMPIYVGYHSADVWANRSQFLLNRKGYPLLVSGVPPDAFSETGQLWGSPLYDWKAMKQDGFSWWVRRMRRAKDLYDEFRIDHFRGFAGFWAVSSDESIALNGRWKAGPGKSLFDAILREVGQLDIIAEDLGVITEDVVELRKSIGAPGMSVLQFGFGGDADNPHLLHNHESNQVAYSGTHDNDTVLGWWETLSPEEISHVRKLTSITEKTDVPWEMIKLALSSVAQTAIVPMQDILGLGSSARMNTPATQAGNWSWRIPTSVSFASLENEAAKLRDMLSLYGRL